jgi:hypothetical protein
MPRQGLRDAAKVVVDDRTIRPDFPDRNPGHRVIRLVFNFQHLLRTRLGGTAGQEQGGQEPFHRKTPQVLVSPAKMAECRGFGK